MKMIILFAEGIDNIEALVTVAVCLLFWKLLKKQHPEKKNKSQIAHVTSQFTSLNSALACFDVHYRNICSVCLRVSLDTALSRSHSTVHSKRMDHLVHKGLGKDMSEGQRAGC